VRENAASKAERYLLDGRLSVERVGDGDVVRARVLGYEGDLYVVHWDRERCSWWCSCPALGVRCAHVLALARVVRKPGGVK
jgi:uncharacterized Zn finger protein